MSDYTQYIPQTNSTTYPTSINNCFTALTSDVTALENDKLNIAGGAMTGLITNFESTGIDDNASATTLVISATGNATFNGNIIVTGSTTLGSITARNDGLDQTLTLWNSDLGVNDRSVSFKSPTTDSTTEPFRWVTSNSFAWVIGATEALLIDSGGDAKFSGVLKVGVDIVAVKDAALTNTIIVSADASGRITTSSGIATSNIAQLSGTQTITGNKTFSGTTIAVTQTSGDNSTKLATTAYVESAIATQVIDWSTTEEIGVAFSYPTSASCPICSMSQNVIALLDTNTATIRTYVYNSVAGTWSLKGTALVVASLVGGVALVALNSTDIVVFNGGAGNLNTYRFNYNTGLWAVIGTGISISNSNATMARLNATDIAFADDVADTLRTYSFSTSTWTLVGNALTLTGLSSPYLASLNSTDISFSDFNSGILRTYRFDGTNWAQLGNSLTLTTQDRYQTALNETDIVISHTSGTRNFIIYRFDGTNWSAVTDASNIVHFPSGISAMSGEEFTVFDQSADTIRRFRVDSKHRFF